MTASDRDRLGTYLTCSGAGGTYRAFLPPPLLPRPPLRLSGMEKLLERANQAIGRLDGVTSILPDPELFLYVYVRKEAVLSSQIEGTQSSLADLLLFEAAEAPGVPFDDVREVSNYVAAIQYGLERLRGGFPLSLRLIREMHDTLLKSGRGASKDPGSFRRSQNWIGGTSPANAIFVPPPPERVIECLDDLEKFIHHNSIDIPVLVKAALIHVQFETIHPFLDGNGRLGRLLITLMLCEQGVLREPMLYLSLYFKTHRMAYYDLLQRVRESGDWESWVEFFLEGVHDTAAQAAELARRVLALFDQDRRRISDLGRAAASPLRVHQAMQKRPLATAGFLAKTLGLSVPTVNAALKHLLHLGTVQELTGRQRGRIFAYRDYLALLSEGTEPLPATA